MATRIRSSLKDCQTNRERVLTYIANHDEITPLLAFSEWQETRLATYIFELREEGWEIESILRRADSGKLYAAYRLTALQDGLAFPLSGSVPGGMCATLRRPDYKP